MFSEVIDGQFKIKDFDRQKCFSSFLPGIAGQEGVPMWVFYVNRGQAIASFGIENKDKAIMEFKPADQSYSTAELKGFRTFLKIDGTYYEAFSSKTENNEVERTMNIDKNVLSIKEINKKYSLEIEIVYFIVPQEDFGALARVVNIKNLGERKINIEIIDGFPELIPYGVSNSMYKDMGFTARAWMEVSNIDKGILNYKVRSSIGDSELVEEVKSAYFYFATNEGKLLKNIYDKNIIFGYDTSLQEAKLFKEKNLETLLNEQQYNENILPCAFAAMSKDIEKEECICINSMVGFSDNPNIINEYVESMMINNFFDSKKNMAQKITDDLAENIYTKTSNEKFDEYCKQNYIDNILRGGYPLTFKNEKEDIIYHIFSRKHGDLERDYNFFSLQAKKYSQGNGNFRDVLQNRRNDVFFNPDIGEFNLKMFANFIQADGYNPLVIKGTTFKLLSEIPELKSIVENKLDEVKNYLKSNKFTPGDLLSFIDRNEIRLKVSSEEFIKKILYYSSQYEEAEFGEGYWIDHWTYLMDLVESYLEIYPDKLKEILFDKKVSKVYSSSAFVKPRHEKYKLINGKVIQIEAIKESKEKEKTIRENEHSFLTDINKKVYKTTIFNKLLLLAVTKFINLDPYGMGIEMEANKPGWNDALNGLPAMFGSGMSETFELKRLTEFLRELLINSMQEKITLFFEFSILIEEVEKLLDNYFDTKDKYEYWNKVNYLKESYRNQVFMNIDGKEEEIKKNNIIHFLNKVNTKLSEGIEKSKEFGDGIYPTYFVYNLKKYEEANEKIIPKEFGARALPLFLEGPTRALKVIKKDERKDLYRKILESNIYDKKLKMYKTSESIENESIDIGRLRAFTPGWLENESVFMHMEFKYLLELLKGELYEEFYDNIKHTMPPYLSYEKYGRNIFENSSFIVSSANSNTKMHGQGFSARLSGSTAEFLSMWKYMFVGKELFSFENGELHFKFEPLLHNEFFDSNGNVQYKLFSSTNVVYINKTGKSTYGVNSAKISNMGIKIENEVIYIEGNKLSGIYATKLRNKEITDIICNFE